LFIFNNLNKNHPSPLGNLLVTGQWSPQTNAPESTPIRRPAQRARSERETAKSRL